MFKSFFELANVPNFLTNIKEGDIVKRSSKEIEDWFYIDDKKMIGGFSITVLQNRQKKRSTEKPKWQAIPAAIRLPDSLTK